VANLQQTDPEGAAPNHERVRVLVVDDSPYILEGLTSFLKEHPGFDLVGTAMDGRQALRRVAALEPDLVLMDMNMPRMSGLEATQRIKESKRGSVVIIMTADDNPKCRAAALAAGADGFVGKDGALFTKLQSAIRRAVRGARL
jgi:DNA-binding NarL/FixJ family response regulator